MATETEKIIVECRKNLGRERAVATGIGVFAVIINGAGDPLLRRRTEKDSLFGQDLSGKWEMTGGGAEISHFKNIPGVTVASSYQQQIFICLRQELKEEAGLMLRDLPEPLTLIPAWLWRETDSGIIIDLAFSVLIEMSNQYIEETPEFMEKITRGELMFVPRKKLPSIDIVSPRTRFLIQEALRIVDSSL